MIGVHSRLPNTTLACLSTAGSWVLLSIVLYQCVDAKTFSICLFSLLLSELFSEFLIAGLYRQEPCFDSPLSLEDCVGHIMLRWVILTSFLVFAAYADLLVFFRNHYFSMLCVLGLCLILTLIKSTINFQRNARMWMRSVMQTRLLFVACVIALATKFRPVNADLVLTSTIAVMLCVLMGFLWKPLLLAGPRSNTVPWAAFLGHSVSVAVPLLFRNADLLILPWIFPPDQVLVYLLVRGIAGVIGLTLGSLTSKLRAPLCSAFVQGKNTEFVAVAARVNLSVLLIGGGACLAVLSAGPYFLGFVGVGSDAAQKLLAWVVLAESAPAFFGATSILLEVTKKQREAVLLASMSVLMIWLLPAIMHKIDIIDLAIVFACVRFAATAAAATILGLRFGILPGLTAILFRQIRLF